GEARGTRPPAVTALGGGCFALGRQFGAHRGEYASGGTGYNPRRSPAIFRAIRTALGTVQRPQTRGIVHHLLPARRCRMEPLPKGANFVRSYSCPRLSRSRISVSNISCLVNAGAFGSECMIWFISLTTMNKIQPMMLKLITT